LQIAAEQGRMYGEPVKVVFPSSIAAYGFGSLQEKTAVGAVTEYEHCKPSTMYGCNKLYCEHLGRYYAHSYRQLAKDSVQGDDKNRGVVDFRCVRYPGLISAETVPTGGTSDFVPEMLHAAARGDAYTCFVREDSRIPFMTMPEAIDATLQLAAAPRKELTQIVYNIASFNPSAGEVAELVKQYFPDASITFEPDERRQAIVDSWPEDLDCSAAHNDWGFTPKYTVEHAFEEYLVPRITKQYESKK
jgi:threonine 3-dehydrogenase